MTRSVVTVTLNPAVDKTVTIPTLQVGGLNRVSEIRTDPGGKGINVAKVLHNFGVDVTATGLIAGSQGKGLLEQLKAKGIRHQFQEVPGETRVNLKIYAAEEQVTTELNECGFSISAEQRESFSAILQALLRDASLLVLGGSLAQGMPTDIYRDYIQLAKESGVKTFLDADGEALKAGLEATPFAIKPNLFELEQLVGRELKSQEEILAAGRELIAQGISLLAVSMGGDGALFLNQEEAYRVKPFPIQVQSTVGAGDSMVAAIVQGVLQEYPLEQIAAWAATAGTVTASKPGTQVCTLEEVQQNVQRVEITKL